MAVSKLDAREERFAAVWEAVDLDRVNAEIDGSGAVYTFDKGEAFDAIYAACRRWLIEDLDSVEVRGVEQTFEEDDFKYVLDLHGVFTGGGSKIIQDERSFRSEALVRWKGLRFVADWKTTSMVLDARWQDKYTDGMQWRAYLARTGADVFVFRGIRRKRAVGDEHETREFAIHRSAQPDLEEMFKRNLAGVRVMESALIDLNVVPWPQNRPDRCNKYGGCRYKNSCDAGLAFIPIGNLEKGRRLSFSRMDDFLSCPELHRRAVLDRIAQDEDTSGPDADFGAAFHRGIAEVYRQVFLPGDEQRG